MTTATEPASTEQTFTDQTFSEPTFTDQAWRDSAALRSSIDELPFLLRLADGTLDAGTFSGYLAQDALYLGDYARVLAAAASQCTDPDELMFWANSAYGAIAVERQLHETRVAPLDATEPTVAEMMPVCRAYTSYLWALVGQGCYPVLAAAILPCFWIYDDVGSRLKNAVADLAGHPYSDWIATYGDPDFAESTRQARVIVDTLAQQSSPEVTARMYQAFRTSCRYEWMFWDAPSRDEAWPS